MIDTQTIAEKIIQDLKYAKMDGDKYYEKVDEVQVVKDCLDYYLADDGK